MSGADDGPRWLAVPELIGLASLAVAHPIVDKLWDNDEYFFAHQSTPGDVVALLALLYVGVPLLFGALIGSGYLVHRGVGRVFHALVRWALLAVFLAPAFGAALGDGRYGVAVAATLAAATVVARARYAPVREFLALTGTFAVMSAGGFVVDGSVYEVVFPGAVDATRTDGPTHAVDPVVVLVFDEMPLSVLLDDELQIDAARFPAFGRLAATSHWFRNASAVSTHTTLAVPAILDGRLPSEENKSPSLKRHPNNLFTLLDPFYALDVHEELTHLCPAYACPVDPDADALARLRLLVLDTVAVYLRAVVSEDLNERYKFNLPDVETNWSHFWGHGTRLDEDNEHRRDRFDRVLASFADGEEPMLHFAHHVVPHMPYQFFPSGLSYPAKSVPRGYKNEAWVDDDWALTQAYQQFLLQVQYLDRELGRVLDALAAQGRLDSALIVVTTDHGASFVPGHHRRGTYPKEHYYETVLSIPLFVKLPGQTRGVVDDRNVSSVDLLPTIAGQLGLTVPHAIDGQDLFSAAWADPGPKRMVMGSKAKKEKINEPDLSYQSFSFPDPLAGGSTAAFPRFALDWQVARFGTGATRPRAPYDIGPRPELLGQPAETAADGPCRVTLSEGFGDQWASGARVIGAADRQIPAHVFGTVRCGRSPLPRSAAAIVDGRVVATTWLVPKSKTSAAWEFLLPEDALGPGEHTIAFHDIDAAPLAIPIAPAAP